MSEKSNIKILEECIGHCPLQVLYSNLDMEAADNLCTQYMEKNNVQIHKCHLCPKEENDMMYA